MNEQLEQIAEDTGVPADLLERAAEARAHAAGSSAAAIVAGWAGEGPPGESAAPEPAPAPEPAAAAPEPAAVPAVAETGAGQVPESLLRRSAAAKAKREGRPLDEVLAEMGLAPEGGEPPAAVVAELADVEPAPAPEPAAAAPEPAAVPAVAETGAGQVPESLLRRSAAAKAKREGRPLDEVLAEMGLAPEGGEPAPAPAAVEQETPAPATAPADTVVPAELVEEEQEPAAVFAGFPRWLAASFIIIPMIAVLYAAMAPSGPDCGTSGQLAINPTTGEAESCGGGISPFFTAGQAVYTEKCVACHGADGGGGVGPAFAGGAVLVTFPDCPDQIDWVTTGSAAWPDPTYGATNKPVLGAGSPMPSFGAALSPEEIASVVLYERVAFGGQDVAEAETTCGLVDAAG